MLASADFGRVKIELVTKGLNMGMLAQVTPVRPVKQSGSTQLGLLVVDVSRWLPSGLIHQPCTQTSKKPVSIRHTDHDWPNYEE